MVKFLILLFIKVWYDKLKEKNYPDLIVKNIELSNNVRVNILQKKESLI
jgi:hypothetical protein